MTKWGCPDICDKGDFLLIFFFYMYLHIAPVLVEAGKEVAVVQRFEDVVDLDSGKLSFLVMLFSFLIYTKTKFAVLFRHKDDWRRPRAL